MIMNPTTATKMLGLINEKTNVIRNKTAHKNQFIYIYIYIYNSIFKGVNTKMIFNT
jgi:hypothetical protein